jgi:hypothetical protein
MIEEKEEKKNGKKKKSTFYYILWLEYRMMEKSISDIERIDRFLISNIIIIWS